MAFDAYDRIRVINLRSRADRRREMKRELGRLGLANDNRVQFFDAVEPDGLGHWRSRGEHGCFLSHLGILKEASAAGESILVLEDDCDFTDAALTSDWGRGADIFYGGYYAADPARLQESNIQGSHCIGFSAAMLPRVIEYLEHLFDDPMPPPIDGAYVNFRRTNPDVLTSFATPPVAVQRQSASDIHPSPYDRSRLLGPVVGLLRKFNRGRHKRKTVRAVEEVTAGAKRSPDS
jgi:glycosyl transferase family 25